MGNLAYEIDDETIVEFFKPAGTLTGLRWLTRKETGEFRVRVHTANTLPQALIMWIVLLQGCGYCEFGTTEEADKAIKFNGVELLGRYNYYCCFVSEFFVLTTTSEQQTNSSRLGRCMKINAI